MFQRKISKNRGHNKTPLLTLLWGVVKDTVKDTPITHLGDICLRIRCEGNLPSSATHTPWMTILTGLLTIAGLVDSMLTTGISIPSFSFGFIIFKLTSLSIYIFI